MVKIKFCDDVDSDPREHFKVMENFKKIHHMMMKIPLPDGLSSSDFFLLSTLLFKCDKCATGMQVSVIAEKMHISAPAVSKTLSTLEERGLIERSVDMNNRRNTWVKITEKGEQSVLNAHNYIDTYMDDVVKRMGEDNLHKLYELILMLRTTFEEKLNEEKEKISEHD